jgi:virginiamycin A acetyltransferase
MNTISKNAKISKFCDIEFSVKGSNLFIDDDSQIDSFVKIKFTGGDGNIKIGKGSYLNSGCVLYSGNGITIGNDVLIAANCTFAPVNHEYKSKDLTIKAQRFKKSKGGIIIEDDVWIGAGTVILDGSVIKKGAVIGAGSIVSGTIESYSVNTGRPLKIIKFRK